MSIEADRVPLANSARRLAQIVATALLLLVGVVSPSRGVASWDPAASRPFAANGANGVAVASDGSVFLVSAFDNQVRKYDARGNLLLTIGSFGTGQGQFNLPSALTIAPGGDVYVTDVGGARVERFTQGGVFVSSYGSSATLSNPRGVAVDPSGNVYVADVGTGLKKFGPSGALVQSYPSSVISQGFAVAIAANGDLYVSDFAPSPQVVKRIDPATGAVLQVISGFGQPVDIDIDANGNLHVLDFNSSTVRSYSPAGVFIEATAPFSTNMIAIAIDQYGRMFASGGGSVTTFNPTPVQVSLSLGAAGDASGDAAFNAVTAGQATKRIDFDSDGFDDLAAHTFRPIPQSTYQSLGVSLVGLDARSVGTSPWAHSMPIGAWQTGFSQPAQPYSFVFTNPVASFGLFGNDVEADVAVTVYLVGGGREFFRWPSGGGANITRFFGLTTAGNVITKVEFDTGDYHIIDDVRFGIVDSAPPTVTIASPASGATFDLASAATVSFACNDNVAVASCVGDRPAGGTLDTSAPGAFVFQAIGTDTAGLTGSATSSYTVSSTIAAGLGLDGSITSNPAGHPVTIVDAPDAADGVVITVSGTGTTKVTLTVCGGFIVRLAPGSEVTLTCGSVIAEVAAGTAEIVTPSGAVTMSVPAGGSARLEANGSASNSGTVAVTITAGGTTQQLAPNSSAAWRTEGFFAPVDMGGVWNTTKAGSNVPIKFKVFFGGATISNPAAITTSFTVVSCTGGSEDVLEVLDAAGATTLVYTGTEFHLNWKTPKQAGACYRASVSSGGTPLLSALFKLK